MRCVSASDVGAPRSSSPFRRACGTLPAMVGTLLPRALLCQCGVSPCLLLCVEMAAGVLRIGPHRRTSDPYVQQFGRPIVGIPVPRTAVCVETRIAGRPERSNDSDDSRSIYRLGCRLACDICNGANAQSGVIAREGRGLQGTICGGMPNFISPALSPWFAPLTGPTSCTRHSWPGEASRLGNRRQPIAAVARPAPRECVQRFARCVDGWPLPAR